MKSKYHGILLSSVTLFILLAGSLGNIATAASKSSTSNAIKNNANSMQLSPLRTDITVKAGATKTVTVNVKNLTDKTVILRPIENDFVAGDESGRPALILDENSYAPTHSLKRFMVPLHDVTIPAHGAKDVKVTIIVPANAQAGGYFGALRFAPAGKGDAPVALSSSVASLILMTIPGPTVEQLNLTNFDVQQNGNSASNFRNPNNLSLLMRFENKGNLQEAPFGQVQVLKGKKVVYKYDFNQKNPKQVVLPDSARRWSVPLKGFGSFGKYTVSGTFGYANGKSIEVSKTVWIIPLWLILVAVGVLFLLIIFIITIRARMTSRKRRTFQARR